MVSLRSPGLWLFIGGLEILFLVHLAEALYPGYSVSDNYISDLGIGPMPSSGIFAAAVILFGVMAMMAAYLLNAEDKASRFWLLLMLAGIGAVGVGVFNLDINQTVHGVSAFLAFFFGNLAALLSYRKVRAPASYLFALLGLIGLGALALFGTDTFLGLGAGGMERMVFYPAMFWVLGFGAYLMAGKDAGAQVAHGEGSR